MMKFYLFPEFYYPEQQVRLTNKQGACIENYTSAFDLYHNELFMMTITAARVDCSSRLFVN